jgi:hypothetical protein
MPDTHLAHEPFDPDRHYPDEYEEPFEQCFTTPRQDRSGSSSAGVYSCPKCQSTRIDARHRARKVGGAIGTVAGATSGIAFALSGAEAGAVAGMLAGPAGAVCGAIAGAVIAGLVGGAAGCATGSVFGEIVDDNVLNDFLCHACGHTFTRSREPA